MENEMKCLISIVNRYLVEYNIEFLGKCSSNISNFKQTFSHIQPYLFPKTGANTYG